MESLRAQIRRYRALLAATSDAAAKKALADLIDEAQERLKAFVGKDDPPA